jgi:hypothetical protein
VREEDIAVVAIVARHFTLLPTYLLLRDKMALVRYPVTKPQPQAQAHLHRAKHRSVCSWCSQARLLPLWCKRCMSRRHAHKDNTPPLHIYQHDGFIHRRRPKSLITVSPLGQALPLPPRQSTSQCLPFPQDFAVRETPRARRANDLTLCQPQLRATTPLILGDWRGATRIPGPG